VAYAQETESSWLHYCRRLAHAEITPITFHFQSKRLVSNLT